MLVNAVGYSGTGSSAIIHLLSEYQNTTTPQLGKYEHVLFYTPHGLFDLEDRLILNNSIHNSDAAINDFYSAMKRLNDNNFGWFGGYEKHFGKKFMEIVDEFVDELTQYSIAGYWSNDFKYKKSIAAVGKDIVKILLRKPIMKFGQRVDCYGDGVVKYCFLNKKKFYELASRFVKKYCELINPDSSKVLLVDQLLLPHNLYRIQRYFEDDIRCIVLDRDPRDMYVLSKYVWSRMGSALLFPDNVTEFVDFYTGLCQSEIYIEDPRILRLHFEDLIYKYDETVDIIEKFVGKDALGTHTSKGKIFIPENSKKNTQNYNIDSAWKEEVFFIEQAMKDKLYDFPYEFRPLLEETTDP